VCHYLLFIGATSPDLFFVLSFFVFSAMSAVRLFEKKQLPVEEVTTAVLVEEYDGEYMRLVLGIKCRSGYDFPVAVSRCSYEVLENFISDGVRIKSFRMKPIKDYLLRAFPFQLRTFETFVRISNGERDIKLMRLKGEFDPCTMLNVEDDVPVRSANDGSKVIYKWPEIVGRGFRANGFKWTEENNYAACLLRFYVPYVIFTFVSIAIDRMDFEGKERAVGVISLLLVVVLSSSTMIQTFDTEQMLLFNVVVASFALTLIKALAYYSLIVGHIITLLTVSINLIRFLRMRSKVFCHNYDKFPYVNKHPWDHMYDPAAEYVPFYAE